MQTLNLQAPKTLDVDVSAKTKGTQPTKKTPSKKQPDQTKKASFKEMVDESAKYEEAANSRNTQQSNTTQETVNQQNHADKATAERTRKADLREGARMEGKADEVTQKAAAFAQDKVLEASWLQSALGTQSAQEQRDSALAESLNESEIAFLKTDPLFDEGFGSTEANLSFVQSLSAQEADQATIMAGSEQQGAADELLANTEDEMVALNSEASELLEQMGDATALFEPAETNTKQKAKASLMHLDAQTESLEPLGTLAFASDEAADAPAAIGESSATADVQAAQNELLGGVFTVTDLRTPSQKDERTGEAVNPAKAQAGDGRQELSLELSLPQVNRIVEHTNVKEAGTVPSFQRLLSEQLRSGAPEFAKAGSIVLRGENEGTIKLTLRPESLGNVKINLQLSDNVITGKIAVASKEAFEAFKQNIGALRQAFSDSGFEGAEFTLSYFDSSSGFAQESGGQNDGRFLSSRAYADYVSGEGSSVGEGETQVFALDSDKTVNVVA